QLPVGCYISHDVPLVFVEYDRTLHKLPGGPDHIAIGTARVANLCPKHTRRLEPVRQENTSLLCLAFELQNQTFRLVRPTDVKLVVILTTPSSDRTKAHLESRVSCEFSLHCIEELVH